MKGDVTVCDYCGQEWHEGDPAEGWLSIEILRGDASAVTDFLDADFCSQAHASEWFQQPLPPIQPLPLPVTPRTWKDRASDGLVLLLFLWALALMLLGSYALVRLLGGWD